MRRDPAGLGERQANEGCLLSQLQGSCICIVCLWFDRLVTCVHLEPLCKPPTAR